MKAIAFRSLGGALLLGAFAACGPSITDVGAPREVDARSSVSFGSTLVECPVSTSSSVTDVITPLGGIVSVGGTSISVPAGAVLVPTTITVTVPASTYMEIDISVEGVEHFIFEQPVTVTLDYSRCSRGDLDKAPLNVWYIDSATKSLLELMPGVDDKVNRSVTFITGHLSGYALAN